LLPVNHDNVGCVLNSRIALLLHSSHLVSPACGSREGSKDRGKGSPPRNTDRSPPGRHQIHDQVLRSPGRLWRRCQTRRGAVSPPLHTCATMNLALAVYSHSGMRNSVRICSFRATSVPNILTSHRRFTVMTDISACAAQLGGQPGQPAHVVPR
jgi:hypothetical protein